MGLRMEGASQAEGAISWEVRAGCNLGDDLIDLIFYRRIQIWPLSSRVRSRALLLVFFLQLHDCLPGSGVSLTLDKGKADPTEKGRG